MKQQNRHKGWQQRTFILLGCIGAMEANAQYEEFSGGYLGIRAGMAEHKNECSATAITCDGKGTGVGLFGGYDFNEHYGVEFSAANLGESTVEYPAVTLDGSVSAIDLSFKYSRDLFASTRWFAKIGAAYWQVDVDGWDEKLNESGVRPTLGAGAEWLLGEHWSARLEYQYLSDVGSDAVGHTDVHFLNLGLSWHFAPRIRDYEISMPASAPATAAADSTVASTDSSPSVSTRSTTTSRAQSVAGTAPQPNDPAVATVSESTATSSTNEMASMVVDDQIRRPLFPADSAVLEDARALEPIAIHLMRNPNLLVRIVAHTDDRGTRERNQQLSRTRAETVADYLRWQGVAPERITAVGKGEDEPVADNSTHAGRARNRRVEFHFTDTQNRR